MTETNFISIKEAVEEGKGNFKGVVIKVSDLKSGTNQNGDWTMKTFTVQDASGEIDIAAFNDDIKLMEHGGMYEFSNLWWKEYQGKTSVQIGKYGIVKKIGEEPQPAPKEGQTTIPEESPDDIPKLPHIPETLKEFAFNETINLLLLEKEIREIFQKYCPNQTNNDARLGMFVKEIYRKSQKTKFEKASDM